MLIIMSLPLSFAVRPVQLTQLKLCWAFSGFVHCGGKKRGRKTNSEAQRPYVPKPPNLMDEFKFTSTALPLKN